jgi:hypothetical protein
VVEKYKNFNLAHDYMSVDFDGTLQIRPRNEPLTVLGEPIWPMVNLVKSWLADGMKVKIMTARVSPIQRGMNDYKSVASFIMEQEYLIQEWCEKYIGQKLPVTCSKDTYMYQLYDDRAVCIEHNKGNIIGINKGW